MDDILAVSDLWERSLPTTFDRLVYRKGLEGETKTCCCCKKIFPLYCFWGPNEPRGHIWDYCWGCHRFKRSNISGDPFLPGGDNDFRFECFNYFLTDAHRLQYLRHCGAYIRKMSNEVIVEGVLVPVEILQELWRSSKEHKFTKSVVQHYLQQCDNDPSATEYGAKPLELEIRDRIREAALRSYQQSEERPPADDAFGEMFHPVKTISTGTLSGMTSRPVEPLPGEALPKKLTICPRLKKQVNLPEATLKTFKDFEDRQDQDSEVTNSVLEKASCRAFDWITRGLARLQLDIEDEIKTPGSLSQRYPEDEEKHHDHDDA